MGHWTIPHHITDLDVVILSTCDGITISLERDGSYRHNDIHRSTLRMWHKHFLAFLICTNVSFYNLFIITITIFNEGPLFRRGLFMQAAKFIPAGCQRQKNLHKSGNCPAASCSNHHLKKPPGFVPHCILSPSRLLFICKFVLLPPQTITQLCASQFRVFAAIFSFTKRPGRHEKQFC